MGRWSASPTRALIADAVPLRLLGALHDLALSDPGSELAAAYPSARRSGDAQTAWAAALTAMDSHAETLARFMDHEPQTNEVRRSACLLPGFLTIAEATPPAVADLRTGRQRGAQSVLGPLPL